MAKSGLLILTQPLSHLRTSIPQIVEEAAVIVSDTLYICLRPALQNQHMTQEALIQPLTTTSEVQSVVTDFYLSGSKVCHTLDIRVLLSHICSSPSSFSPVPYKLKKEVSVLLSDSAVLKNMWTIKRMSLVDILRSSFGNINQELNFVFISAKLGEMFSTVPEMSHEVLKTYSNVVLGGTFDRLHAGHKLLLSESCLLCDRKLTVGITSGENKRKLLWELMEPYLERERSVVDFVTEVKPNIIMEPVKIFDAFGPTKIDPDLQCIVVSQETEEGGRMVNEERQKLGIGILDMVTVDLVDDICHAEDEELKISSSSQRKRLLGTLLHPLSNRSSIPIIPYRVAVTGGIASGKSNVCSELEKLGARVVNCDLLGHQAYLKGTSAYHSIVNQFGDHLLDSNGEIDRRKLGAIVFSDKSKLDTLNSIVWPAIRQLAETEIENLRKSGVDMVILEAAVLFEAGWDDMVHEVWTTFVPREEALRRLMERNGLSQDDAERRIDSQISNTTRIEKSNVVICPQWEFEVTRKQVLKAWTLLKKRIDAGTHNKL